MSVDQFTDRPLADLYPDLERLGAEYHHRHHTEGPLFTPAVLACLPRIVRFDSATPHGLVLGCGPAPRAVLAMADAGFVVTGVEPVRDNVRTATAFVGERATVVEGSAEAIPLPDGSQDFVLMESVLEHVDSPPRSLAEIFRVLKPGGLVYIYTTCRTKFHPRGFNGEYSVPFLNWFPAAVREAYVHHQQHFAPALANYNARPAFHWYTYTELVKLGRYDGFAQLSSLLDVVPPDSPFVQGSRLRRWLMPRVQRRPWLRALVLTQTGGSIFMVKRKA
ncbi:MAG: class I SAM-dependent methyltransferase [Gemmatimonadota bacterium]